jgi:hypothetical protein
MNGVHFEGEYSLWLCSLEGSNQGALRVKARSSLEAAALFTEHAISYFWAEGETQKHFDIKVMDGEGKIKTHKIGVKRES